MARGVAAVGMLVLLATACAAQRIYEPPAPSPGRSQDAHPTPMPKSAPPAVAKPQLPPVVPPPKPDPLVAEHDLRVGTFYYNRGAYVGALARFEDAIYNDPHSPEAYCRAGDAELKLNHFLPARVDWRHCEQAAESGKWAEHARKALAKLAKTHPGP
jgi:tetratricopeptide (TPR) repeat protein